MMPLPSSVKKVAARPDDAIAFFPEEGARRADDAPFYLATSGRAGGGLAKVRSEEWWCAAQIIKRRGVLEKLLKDIKKAPTNYDRCFPCVWSKPYFLNSSACVPSR